MAVFIDLKRFMTEILTHSQVASGLSVINKTGDASGYALSRVALPSKSLKDASVLTDYPHLKFMDLSDNALQDLNFIETANFLLSLDVHNNQLLTLPQSLDSKRYLQKIDASSNQISRVDCTQVGLTSLILNSNLLTSLHLNFTQLTFLQVKDNALETVTLACPKLTHLYLDGNKLTQLSILPPSLQVLSLGRNQLTSLDTLSNLVFLQELDVKSNQIAAFDALNAIKDLKKCTALNLNGNPIDQNEAYRLEVVLKLSQLSKLDEEIVIEEEREEAALFAEKRKETE